MRRKSGYEGLLLAIWGKEPEVLIPIRNRECRNCGCLINKVIQGQRLCLACYRVWNRERVKKNNGASARVIALKEYPIAQKCSIIGCNETGERHHPDYSKPREIIWLCPKHHKEFGNDLTYMV